MDQGYPLEEHFVTTADGYVLGLFRIPRGAGEADGAEAGPGQSSQSGSSGSRSSESTTPSPACRPPVLLLHGVLDSSAAWVLNRPEQSLGFILADAGYDVWLGTRCFACDWWLLALLARVAACRAENLRSGCVLIVYGCALLCLPGMAACTAECLRPGSAALSVRSCVALPSWH